MSSISKKVYKWVQRDNLENTNYKVQVCGRIKGSDKTKKYVSYGNWSLKLQSKAVPKEYAQGVVYGKWGTIGVKVWQR